MNKIIKAFDDEIIRIVKSELDKIIEEHKEEDALTLFARLANKIDEARKELQDKNMIMDQYVFNELFNYINPYRKKMIQQINKISEEENPIKLMKYNDELNKAFEMEPYKTIYEQSLYRNEKPKTK